MDETGRKKLWEEYDKTKSPEVREKIILEYAPLVKMVAGRLSMYLGYNVEYEDLVSYGIFGLIDAIACGYFLICCASAAFSLYFLNCRINFFLFLSDGPGNPIHLTYLVQNRTTDPETRISLKLDVF